MNFQEFVEAVKEEVVQVMKERRERGEVKNDKSHWMHGKIKIELHTNLKNNGKELVGIIIRDEAINIAPTIYLEEFYAELCEEYSIHDMACRIIREYEKVRFHHSWNIEGLHDYESIKKQIACKLINLEKNKELLEDTPYIPFLDLAIVFYVLVEVTEKGSATMLVKNSQKESWKVDNMAILGQALKNMESLLPAKFQTITSVISEITEINAKASEEERMYVLSNNTRNFGAACILYPGKLKEIGNYLGMDYYILPSSIHEVIIVSDRSSLSREDLENMVCEVNETQVAEEEVLSDCVYHYKRDEQRLLY